MTRRVAARLQLLLLAAACGAASAAAPHPDHASAGEARLDAGRNVLETSVQLDAQHLAEALARFAGRPVAPERERDDPAVRALLADYLRTRVAARTPAGAASLRLVGFESAGFDAWLHFEILLPPGPAGETLELRQLLLREHLEGQENLLEVRTGDAHDVVRFAAGHDGWAACAAPLPERTTAAPLLPLGAREDWRLVARAADGHVEDDGIALALGGVAPAGCAEARLVAPRDGASLALRLGAASVRFAVAGETVVVALADDAGETVARCARPATLGATPRGDLVCTVSWSADGLLACVDALPLARRSGTVAPDAVRIAPHHADFAQARAWVPHDASR